MHKHKGVNKKIFDVSRIVAQFKVISIVPLLLLVNFVTSLLMVLYLEIYVKTSLGVNTSLQKELIGLKGCFDSIVDKDIEHLEYHYNLSTNLKDHSTVFTAVNITEWVLSLICFLDLCFIFYCICGL